MPIENRWYAEPLIVLNRMYGEVTIAELSDNGHMNQTYYDHLPEGALLHFIVDMREVTHMPNDLRVTRTVSAPRPNTGWIVLVTSNPLHRMLASMVSVVMHLRYKVVGHPGRSAGSPAPARCGAVAAHRQACPGRRAGCPGLKNRRGPYGPRLLRLEAPGYCPPGPTDSNLARLRM